MASNFFSRDRPFSGQVNLLTTDRSTRRSKLFTYGQLRATTPRYLALGARSASTPTGRCARRCTQGDIASYGSSPASYTTRAPARHRYDIGLSYSTQRYGGGNVAALRDVTDGSRNAGSIYAFDTFAITPLLTLSYGGRYSRYDYLDGRSLFSPRVTVTVAPAEHFRFGTTLSSRAVAPGAEEFMPRMDNGIWLPPQRTFSSLVAGDPLEAERTNHVEFEVERDIASATVSVRAFRQHVENQLVTLFGVNTPGAPSTVGHYFVDNAGMVDASGFGAGIRRRMRAGCTGRSNTR
jgi:hypothetical protein